MLFAGMICFALPALAGTIQCRDLVVLVGKRVTLRPFTTQDEPALRFLFNDRISVQADFSLWRGSHGYSAHDVRLIMQERQRRELSGQAAYFAVEFSDEPTSMWGSCSLLYDDNRPEIARFGICLLHHYWGQGYGEEIFKLVADFAFYDRNIEDLRFVTAQSNVGMNRIAEKLKIPIFRTGRETTKGIPVYEYRLTKEAWSQRLSEPPR
jgi:RimJ/RimL family protein N-acetyltransferase